MSDLSDYLRDGPDYGPIFQGQAAEAAAKNYALAAFHRLIMRRSVNAHRKLFFEPDGVTLKPEAKICLDDWARAARMGKSQVRSSDDDLRAVEGMRFLFLHIMGRFSLHSEKYRRLGIQMEELKDE